MRSTTSTSSPSASPAPSPPHRDRSSRRPDTLAVEEPLEIRLDGEPYVVTMRTPGDVADRVKHTREDYPVDKWQKVASPVWMDINPSDTLQYMSAREHDDERHICPLQLDVIRRGVMLWTNPDDIVLSPFMGIGSEGYVSLEMGRKFVGIELKQSYFKQACQNLAIAEASKEQDLIPA